MELRVKNESDNLWCRPWVDKLVAAALVGESLWFTLQVFSERQGLALLILVVRTVVLNGLLLVRRRPERISLNPLFWGIALLEAYWDLVYAFFRNQPSVALLPEAVCDALSLASVFLLSLARVNLGRSFGIVPADRGIATGGVYRLVRHPIYTAAILGALGYVLGHVSPLNVAVFVFGLVLIHWKAKNEEVFLGTNSAYAAYRKAVPYRFFPRLA
jgi:protein-S-isoprenylcysteine O-methyltransferase Ste14